MLQQTVQLQMQQQPLLRLWISPGRHWHVQQQQSPPGMGGHLRTEKWNSKRVQQLRCSPSSSSHAGHACSREKHIKTKPFVGCNHTATMPLDVEHLLWRLQQESLHPHCLQAPLQQGDGAARCGRPAVQAEPARSSRADAWEQQLPAAGAGGQVQAEGGLLGQAFYLVPACQLPSVLQLQQAPLGLPRMVPGSVPLSAPHPQEPSGEGRGAAAGHEAPAQEMVQGPGSCGAVEPAGQGSRAAQGPQSPDSPAEAAGRQFQDAATSMSQRPPSVGDEAEVCGQDVSAPAEVRWHCYSAVAPASDLADQTCTVRQSCSSQCRLSSRATTHCGHQLQAAWCLGAHAVCSCNASDGRSCPGE